MRSLAHGTAAICSAHNSALAFAHIKCLNAEVAPRLAFLPRTQIFAHKLVRDTAVSMAHELYDAMMMHNEWWQEWQRLNPGISRHALEQRFVNKNLPLLVPQARAALAKCLQPGVVPSMTDAQRAEVAQALILDNQLVDSRAAASAQSADRIRIN